MSIHPDSIVQGSELDLCREAVSELIPYFFENHNVNDAQYIPVHLLDMVSIEQKHPEVDREFFNGHFVVHKSPREFSALAIDWLRIKEHFFKKKWPPCLKMAGFHVARLVGLTSVLFEIPMLNFKAFITF